MCYYRPGVNKVHAFYSPSTPPHVPLGTASVSLYRQVTGTAYDPELFLEQEPLMEGQSPCLPQADLDVPVPLQRAQTEHDSALLSHGQASISETTSLPDSVSETTSLPVA